MFRDLFTNRFPFVGALIFFLLMVVGGMLYMKHVERQEAEKLSRTQEQLKQWEARQQLTENPPLGRPCKADTSTPMALGTRDRMKCR